MSGKVPSIAYMEAKALAGIRGDHAADCLCFGCRTAVFCRAVRPLLEELRKANSADPSGCCWPMQIDDRTLLDRLLAPEPAK